MGDRANIVIKSNGEQVCLYTHWDGCGISGVLCKAMVRGKERWDDFQYLTRIIFCDMVSGREEGLTGYGISQNIHGGDSNVITVDMDKKLIIENCNSFSFDEFISV